ncbi:MAG: hypothetical protein CMH44_05950 [Muricauda sp.]|nr:hypothetical protein [Allomuricauda sp.]
MNKILEAVFTALALTLLITVCSRPFFDLPPLGKVLDPFIGIVQNENEQELKSNGTMQLAGFKNRVRVYFDDRKVPHIFAGNDEDLFRAQGYMAAYFRLWQMEFLALSASGRLSEKLSNQYLDFDRQQNRKGLELAAANSLKLLEQDLETKRKLDAFTEGVNLFIQSLGIHNMPLEYKLLDYRPEKWTNYKSMLIMKYLISVLSGYEEDQSNTRLILTLGEDRFNALYTHRSPHIAPMIESDTIAGNKVSEYVKRPEYLNFSFINQNTSFPKSDYNPNIGSNAWAVGPRMSTSRQSILANDPHLNLTIPSIWIEFQLHSPNYNTYGVSIPGIPGVLIGFNQTLAWGITNGSVDTKDWFKLRIREDYSAYRVNGTWKEIGRRVDTIRLRNGQKIIDTIYTTEFGPIPYDKTTSDEGNFLYNHALRWELYEPNDELTPFLLLGAADKKEDYEAAIDRYRSSALNFVVATVDGTIAAFHQGSIPYRNPGEGMFIQDGTVSAEREILIPNQALPRIEDPESGYLFSANQRPTGYDYHYYYYGYFVEMRALRIRQILDSISNISLEKVKKIQLDDTSYMAKQAVPILLSKLDVDTLSAKEKGYYEEVKAWDYRFSFDNTIAGFYYLWLERIRKYTWDEMRQFNYSLNVPDDFTLIDFIANFPDDEIFDSLSTEYRETASDIVTTAFKETVQEYDGIRQSEGSKWGEHNHVRINHLSKIPELGIPELESAGHPNTINSISSSWGPSWRMVVEMDMNGPKGYGIYPGGQSGNPLSKYYDNSVRDWSRGKFYGLNYFAQESQAQSRCPYFWTFKQ